MLFRSGNRDSKTIYIPTEGSNEERKAPKKRFDSISEKSGDGDYNSKMSNLTKQAATTTHKKQKLIDLIKQMDSPSGNKTRLTTVDLTHESVNLHGRAKLLLHSPMVGGEDMNMRTIQPKSVVMSSAEFLGKQLFKTPQRAVGAYGSQGSLSL